MNCESFVSWLENRDMHDLSEADRAKVHAESCERCARLLALDETLERSLRKGLSSEPLPDEIRNRLEMGLNKSRPRRRLSGVVSMVATACVVVGLVFLLGQRPDFASLDQLSASLLADHLDHVALDIYEEVDDPAAWLATNLGRAVEPPGLLPEGFRVKGIRFCNVEDCQVVHMVYVKGEERVSVFVVDREDTSFHMAAGKTYTVGIDTNRVTVWKKGETVYALVS